MLVNITTLLAGFFTGARALPWLTGHLGRKAAARRGRRLRAMPDYIGTHTALQHYPDCEGARALLGNMADHAARNAGYGRLFKMWLERGSTLAFRDLASPFGEYLGPRDFRNQVNAIDSAHFHRFHPLPPH